MAYCHINSYYNNHRSIHDASTISLDFLSKKKTKKNIHFLFVWENFWVTRLNLKKSKKEFLREDIKCQMKERERESEREKFDLKKK